MPPVKPFLAIGAILVSVGLVTATPAAAQTKEQKAGARAAADAGGDAFDAGRYAEAADLFERAERLLHAPPHLLYAARAHVKLGHLVEARELYLTLTREHLSASAPRVFRDAQQQGEKELAAVEPRLAYASVVVQGGAGASSVRVTRNGEAMPAELLGVPTPINPGEYTYQAFADGMESTTTSVSFREGVRETVVLTLREIPGAKKAATTTNDSPARASGGGSLTDAPPTDSHPSPGRPFLVASLASFGVAVAGGVVGTVFLVQGLDRQREADNRYAELCPNKCADETLIDQEITPIDNDAVNKKNVALGSYIVGGVGLVAGITFLVLDQGRSSSSVAGARVRPVLGLNYAGLAGSF
jgi:hypothetical protein